jgi:hypothetical protein
MNSAMRFLLLFSAVAVFFVADLANVSVGFGTLLMNVLSAVPPEKKNACGRRRCNDPLHAAIFHS